MCVALGSSVPYNERMRHIKNKYRGEFFFHQSRRLIKLIHQGGVPFNISEHSEPSRTRREGRENKKTAIFINMCSYLLFGGLYGVKKYHFESKF